LAINDLVTPEKPEAITWFKNGGHFVHCRAPLNTLEDETGQTSLIIWPSLSARQRRELLNASLLAVVGEVQREGEVQHVIARQLEDHSGLLGNLVTRSRDYR